MVVEDKSLQTDGLAGEGGTVEGGGGRTLAAVEVGVPDSVVGTDGSLALETRAVEVGVGGVAGAGVVVGEVSLVYDAHRDALAGREVVPLPGVAIAVGQLAYLEVGVPPAGAVAGRNLAEPAAGVEVGS
jgi:hypothetical protein